MSDSTGGNSEEDSVLITWTPVTATLVVSLIQGVVFFLFFLWQRNRDMRQRKYDLYEPRQFNYRHRSPQPFEGGSSPFGWAMAAYSVYSEDLLKFVGLDAFMFLRFLRLGTRMAAMGTALSLILLPLYATGEATGDDTEAFNLLTLARVEKRSARLWGPALCWMIFVAFILVEIWYLWEEYAVHRYNYLAKGDLDTPPDYRYAVRVENIPPNLRTPSTFSTYFERLFPGQVRQVSLCMNTARLEKLIGERKKALVSLEKAVAFTNAKPDKPPKEVRDGGMICMGGEKKDAIAFHRSELNRLNREIDSERANILTMTARLNDNRGRAPEQFNEEDKGKNSPDGTPSSTGYVTFTSLRAKQAAVQCEVSGKKDRVDVFAASEPSGIIWENVTMPLNYQRVLEIAMSAFWLVGILFWAVPVTFVTGLANLNGILKSVGLPEQNPNAAWYGIVAGLLPVIFLQILMVVLYLSINAAAKLLIKKKSMPEVGVYALYWHQLFQFANLWLILIGGSLFNQLDSLIEDPASVIDVIANAMPGASIFFVNYIIVASFGAFGMELSMLPTYGVKLILSVIQPEAMRTQRELDEAKKPPTIIWGQQIPPMVFIFLVTALYMTIVPMMEVFGLVFFAGSYLIWKHQCLHVYATEFEGGGTVTWQTVFSFILVALYMAELVFIAYMGIKEGAAQGIVGFVPLIATVVIHMAINRNLRAPLENLSLEVAATIDIQDGELQRDEDGISLEHQLYAQPSLKTGNEERRPMPYRREMGDDGYPEVVR